MPKILHTADLHLKRNGEDKAYGLAVLDEIISVANARNVTHLLICGDLFDSFKDFSDLSLKTKLLYSFERLNSGCKVFYITGNHENLGKGADERLSAYNFGRIRLVAEDVEVFEDGGIEIVAVPFKKNYFNLLSSSFPQKKHFRIIMLHGMSSKVYAGPDAEQEESGFASSQIPDLLLQKAQADYAALGHIHEARENRDNGIIAAYPGSPRVWRKGEKGPRKVIFFETDGKTAGPREEIIIRVAGQYREIPVPINLDGTFSRFVPPQLVGLATQHPNDWFELVFSGAVEDENVFEASKSFFDSLISDKVRKCSLNSLGMKTFSALAGNQMAKKFLEQMEACRPEDGTDAMKTWLAARVIGLEKINEAIK